jgi:hypothetical protein
MTHINHIFAVIGVRDRAQAVHYAYQHGLVAPSLECAIAKGAGGGAANIRGASGGAPDANRGRGNGHSVRPAHHLPRESR